MTEKPSVTLTSLAEMEACLKGRCVSLKDDVMGRAIGFETDETWYRLPLTVAHDEASQFRALGLISVSGREAYAAACLRRQ